MQSPKRERERERKKRKENVLVDLSNGISIFLYHYVGKILKPHDYRLFHFTHQGTCIVFCYLILNDLDLVKIFNDLKVELIYLSLLMNDGAQYMQIIVIKKKKKMQIMQEKRKRKKS